MSFFTCSGRSDRRVDAAVPKVLGVTVVCVCVCVCVCVLVCVTRLLAPSRDPEAIDSRRKLDRLLVLFISAE